MAVYRIPVRPSARSPFFEQRTSLDGAEYVLKFKWNERRSRWTFDLADQSEDPIISGVTVNTGFDFLARVTDSRKPAGILTALDSSGAEGEADTIDGLGGDNPIQLWYLDADEVARLGL